MQPMHIDKDGVVRFKENKIVSFLLQGRDFNEIVGKFYSNTEDLQQLYQLIGYSVDGYCNLNAVDKKEKKRAHRKSQRAYIKHKARLWDERT